MSGTWGFMRGTLVLSCWRLQHIMSCLVNIINPNFSLHSVSCDDDADNTFTGCELVMAVGNLFGAIR